MYLGELQYYLPTDTRLLLTSGVRSARSSRSTSASLNIHSSRLYKLIEGIEGIEQWSAPLAPHQSPLR